MPRDTIARILRPLGQATARPTHPHTHTPFIVLLVVVNESCPAWHLAAILSPLGHDLAALFQGIAPQVGASGGIPHGMG